MPLTRCPECSRDVSTSASSCPHCGHPMAGDVQTTESTGKNWKLQILVSSLLIAFGIFSVFCMGAGQNGEHNLLAVASLGIGLAWFLFARVGAWWNHG